MNLTIRFRLTLLISLLVATALCACLALSPSAYADNEADDSQQSVSTTGQTGDQATNQATSTAADKVEGGTWVKSGKRWWYRYSGGTYPASEALTINGKVYRFDQAGWMRTGWAKEGSTWYYMSASGAEKHGWLKTSGKWYYLDPADGKMLTGKQTIGGATYYLNTTKKPEGAMVVGWNKEDGIWYYYKNSGAMTTGWLKLGRTWYYLDPADSGKMKTGRYQVGNAWYVSNGSGAMYAKKWVQQPEGWYYATASGALKSGWLKDGGKWYWLQPDQGCLMAASTTKTIDNALYSFTSSGAMQANALVRLENNAAGHAGLSGAITRIGTYSGNNVILTDANGNILTGWQKIADQWFYGEANTGIMKTGWLKENGKWYWLKPDGAMATNAWVDGGKYFVGTDGTWVQVNIIQDIRPVLSHGTKTAKYQKYIVLHDTEGGGSPQNVVNWWISDGRYVAAHFVIGKDGTIVQCVPMDQIAHHAGWGTAGHNAKYGVPDDGRDDKRGTLSNSWSNDYGMNSYSIGIELVHNGSTGEAYPKAQLEALDKLIAYIDGYYGKQSTIIDHKMWRNGNSDTSKEFARYLANYRDHRSYK